MVDGAGRDGEAGLLDAGVGTEELATVACDGLTDARALELAELAGLAVLAAVLAAGGAESAGALELVADEQAVPSTAVAPSSSASRRCRRPAVPALSCVPACRAMVERGRLLMITDSDPS